MPEQDGKLTRAEKETVKKWLEEHGAVRPCPQCQVNAWGVVDHIIQLPVTFIVLMYPAVCLICRNCGYFRMHSAVMLGVVPGPPEQPETKEATDGLVAS